MSDSNQYSKPATLCATALGVTGASGGLAPSINMATTFEGYAQDGTNSDRPYQYTRSGNPGLSEAENLITALEQGQDSLLFASGMASAIGVFMALEPGSHVIIEHIMYWSLRNWLLSEGKKMGLEVSIIANGNQPELEATLIPGKTALVWIETPANPTWMITDIEKTASIVHAAGALLCVDSTVATPILTKPLTLGADLVMHSATKYLNGHSDVLGGTLITGRDDEYWQRIRANRTSYGSVLGTFEAWLLLRGMRTLPIRVKAACDNAMAIAKHFENHPRISSVQYPGLASHPGHDIAARQMTGGFGGMMSIRLTGGRSEAARVARETRLFMQATSLGGVESLIEHRGPVEGPDSPVPDDLLRLSIGIEDVDDLIEDLERVL